MERRTFTREFKLEAVQLSYDSAIPVTQVARNLGIRAELLYRWRAEARQAGGSAFPGQGTLKPEEAELARLRRELAQTRLERDILKKALSVFAQPTR
jgi:transposase